MILKLYVNKRRIEGNWLEFPSVLLLVIYQTEVLYAFCSSTWLERTVFLFLIKSIIIPMIVIILKMDITKLNLVLTMVMPDINGSMV